LNPNQPAEAPNPNGEGPEVLENGVFTTALLCGTEYNITFIWPIRKDFNRRP
jgi:hypothetical protein